MNTNELQNRLLTLLARVDETVECGLLYEGMRVVPAVNWQALRDTAKAIRAELSVHIDRKIAEIASQQSEEIFDPKAMVTEDTMLNLGFTRTPRHSGTEIHWHYKRRGVFVYFNSLPTRELFFSCMINAAHQAGGEEAINAVRTVLRLPAIESDQ